MDTTGRPAGCTLIDRAVERCGTAGQRCAGCGGHSTEIRRREALRRSRGWNQDGKGRWYINVAREGDGGAKTETVAGAAAAGGADAWDSGCAEL